MDSKQLKTGFSFSISTTGNAVSFGSLTSSKYAGGSFGSGTRALLGGTVGEAEKLIMSRSQQKVMRLILEI